MRQGGTAPAAAGISLVMRPRHVYVHVPFCARRCAYCDFAIAVRSRVPVDEYVGALAGELALRVGPPGPRRDEWRLDTLYFGGGTPSRLGGSGLARAVAAVLAHATLEPDAEVTAEANPEDVTPEAVAAWVDAGINRLSLGSQSFDPAVLRWMHRTHDEGQIGRAVAAARAGGIENLSLDLIFALPEGIDRSWEADLERALALRPSHLSLYGLTVEPATPLARWVERHEVAEADEERYAAEFTRAHDALTAAGYEHYEVSNFALPGLRARHNSSYWAGVPYLGLGPSAHGFDGVTRRWNIASYPAWVAAIADGPDPIAGSEFLDESAREAERIYLGLRTSDGLVLKPEESSVVDRWISAGWAERIGWDRVRLTADGWLRLDALAASLTVVGSR
jgi:oxygen-independent coproporphyrinogen III oxidase